MKRGQQASVRPKPSRWVADRSRRASRRLWARRMAHLGVTRSRVNDRVAVAHRYTRWATRWPAALFASRVSGRAIESDRPAVDEDRRKVLSHPVQPLALQYRREVVSRDVAYIESLATREDTGLHGAIRHDRQYASGAFAAKLVFGGAGSRVPPAPNASLIVHADAVRMNSDMHELLDCGVDALGLGQSNHSDTKWNAPSHCLGDIRSRASETSCAFRDLVMNVCARRVVARCETDSRL